MAEPALLTERHLQIVHVEMDCNQQFAPRGGSYSADPARPSVLTLEPGPAEGSTQNEASTVRETMGYSFVDLEKRTVNSPWE